MCFHPEYVFFREGPANFTKTKLQTVSSQQHDFTVDESKGLQFVFDLFSMTFAVKMSQCDITNPAGLHALVLIFFSLLLPSSCIGPFLCSYAFVLFLNQLTVTSLFWIPQLKTRTLLETLLLVYLKGRSEFPRLIYWHFILCIIFHISGFIS